MAKEKKPKFSETLPMDEKSRMGRAKEMGFNLSEPQYHGTHRDFSEFSLPPKEQKNTYGTAVYMSPVPRIAEGYARDNPGKNVMPIYHGMNKPFDFDKTVSKKTLTDLKGILGDKITQSIIDNLPKKDTKTNGSLYKEIKAKLGNDPDAANDILKKMGHDGLHIPYEKITAVFDPSKIRSKFAEFDQKKKDKSNLSYAEGGTVGSSGDAPAPSFEDTQPVTQPGALSANAKQSTQPPSFDDTQPLPDYNTPGSSLLGAGEALAKGFLPFGHTATALAEKGLTKLGVQGLSPEEQAGREENLSESHLAGPLEAVGFGLGMLSGASEASLVGKIGEAVTGATEAGKAIQAAQALQKSAALGQRLAAGATKAGTELAAMQADDEISKAVNGTSKGVGDAIVNTGLAGVLGGIGGGAATGLGIAGKGAFNAMGLKEFADRLAFRGANPHPEEALEKEFSDAYQQVRQLGSETGGINGIGSAARDNLMPELHPGMVDQAQELLGKINKVADSLERGGDQSGSLGPLRNQAAKIEEAINENIDPMTLAAQNKISPSNIFETLNGVKRQLGEWGKFNKDLVPLAEQPFRNASKGLGSEFRDALENTQVWGDVGDLQKSLNAAWSKAFKALPDVERQFMQRVGGEPTIDPAKFATYLRQNGKLTNQNIRQQRMGNFIESVEEWQRASADAYEKAGLENPHDPVGLGLLKDSLNKPSTGAKLADLWYDKLTPHALGDAAGMAAGNAVFPGIPGVYAGKWALGPLFGSIIKPIAEKASSLGGFAGAMRFVKQVAEGNNKLAKAVGDVFVGASKTIPHHWIPDAKQLLHLDEQLKKSMADQASLLKVSDGLNHYLPENAQVLSATAMNAVNVLNSHRPSNPKQSPLDADIPPSKAQEAKFQRKLLIAEQPLVVMDHIKDGSLQADDVATLKSIYPDYYQKMSEKLLVSMGEHLHDGGSIPYRTRQGLSLFLGQPLDSTMTPSAIQAVQGIFAQNGPPQSPSQSGGKSRGSGSKLGKMATNLQTTSQAREARSNKV